jgi:hypothetical protein
MAKTAKGVSKQQKYAENLVNPASQDITGSNDLQPRQRQGDRGCCQRSIGDEAKRIQFLKRQGLTIPRIADLMDTTKANVRNCLKLLRLTPENRTVFTSHT